MMKTLVVSAVAAIAIIGAGFAGAAGTSSTPAPASAGPGGPPPGMMGGPGMMGPGWRSGPRGFGMMGMRGRGHFGGFGGGDMGGCMADHRKPGDGKTDQSPKRADLQTCLTQTFNEMDTNHDGKVSFAELKAWREAQRTKREEAAFKRFNGGQDSLSKDQLINKPLARFDAMDTNHDGVISHDEMKAYRDAQRAKWKDQKAPNGQAN